MEPCNQNLPENLEGVKVHGTTKERDELSVPAREEN